MRFTGNIVTDFENYLETVKLWDRHDDRSLRWVDRIGELMDIAAKRTAEQNKQLKKEDYLWWFYLVEMYEFYGFDRDVFGEYLELQGLTSQRNGQFFTPMSICKLTARFAYNDQEEKQPVTVSDCACGSGRMMIGHASVMREVKQDYDTMDYIYYNQDIDYKSFIFTTLNASLRNLRSINVWGDTLAVTERKTYITIPLYVGRAPWIDREHELKRLAELEKEKLRIKKVG